MKKYIIVLISSFLLVLGCGSPSTEEKEPDSEIHPEEQHAGHEHETGDTAVHVSPEKQEDWNIQTHEVDVEDLQTRIQLPGAVALNRNRTADISSYVEGKVTRVEADLGDRVRKGEALAVINSPEFAKAQADFLEARAAYLLRLQEYERAKMLLKEKAIEKKEYERREAAYQQASTKYGALGSALHSYGVDHQYIEDLIKKCKILESAPYKCEVADPFLSIMSPVSGMVVFRDIIIGEHIRPEKNLFIVSDLSRIWVRLDAYEKDLPYLNIESEVDILTSLYEDKIFPGRITYISDVIDEKIRTVTVRVEVDNSEFKLKPNMYVQGRIKSPAVRKQLAVPEAAVQNFEGGKIVFVKTGPDDFLVRKVAVQEQIDGWAVIREGLKPGEIIVQKGAFTLKSELTKGTFGHVHAH